MYIYIRCVVPEASSHLPPHTCILEDNAEMLRSRVGYMYIYIYIFILKFAFVAYGALGATQLSDLSEFRGRWALEMAARACSLWQGRLK
jgi:hypothetical protein